MSAHSVGCVTLWPRSLLLLAALPWGLLSEALASTDNTLQNRSSAAVRVAVLLPGELRFPAAENLQASMAAFDVFISTYVEYEDRAHMLRPKRIVLTDRSTVSLPGGRMWQWYHLDRLLKEYKAELLEYDVLFKTRSDCYFFEPLTAAHFSHVHGEFLHMNSDISFYARAATFFYVYESMFDDVRGKYLRAGHVYFDLDYENLVAAYGIDAVNKQHVHTKRHPTIRYRFTRINLAIAARQLVYPTSVYHRSTKVLIENIESHLRAGLPIDNGKYTNRNLGDNTFASEKFHLVHAINRAPIADFAAPTVGVLLRPRPAAAPGSCPRPTQHDALLQAWRDALADPPRRRPSDRGRSGRHPRRDRISGGKISGGKISARWKRRTTRYCKHGGTRWPRRCPEASASIPVQSRRPGLPRRQSTGSSAALTWRISGDTPTASRRRPTSTPEARASGRKRPEVGNCVHV